MIKLKIRYADNQTEISFPCTEQAMQDAITAIRADPIVGPAELYVAEVIYRFKYFNRNDIINSIKKGWEGHDK